MPLGPKDSARIADGLTPSQAIHNNKSTKSDYMKLVLAIIGIVIILFIMVSLLSSPSQYKIYGFVYEDSTGKANVTITITDIETSESVKVVTDESGYYEIYLNKHFSGYINVAFVIWADGYDDIEFTPSPSDNGIKEINFNTP
jgi:hypothetical protein